MNWNWDVTNWNWDAIAGIAALIGIVISLLALLIARGASDDQRVMRLIEEKRRTDEEKENLEKSKRARLEVSVESYKTTAQGQYEYYLVFNNHGPSVASDVTYRARWKGPMKWESKEWEALVPLSPSNPLTRYVDIPTSSGFDLELNWSDNARPNRQASDKFRFDGSGRNLGHWRVDEEHDGS